MTDSVESALGGILASLADVCGDCLSDEERVDLTETASRGLSLDMLHITKIYPLEAKAHCIAEALTSSGREAYLLENYSFFERHFSRIFDTQEGFGCCADKARFCLGVVRRNIKTEEVGEEVSPWLLVEGERNYWEPKFAFQNSGEIMSFYQSLVFLLGGRPESYLSEMLSLMRRAQSRRAEAKS